MNKRGIKRPVVGKILAVEKHPNAEKLYIATVDVSQLKPVTIIFGGNRVVQVGELVPVSLPGTWLPEGKKTRPRNFRGKKSFGELLSKDELYGTLGGPDEVLILLPSNFSVGEEIRI